MESEKLDAFVAITFGLILVLVKWLRPGPNPKLADLWNLAFSGIAIVAGMRLLYVIFFQDVDWPIQNAPIYIGLASLSLIWTSAVQMVRYLRRDKKNKGEEE